MGNEKRKPRAYKVTDVAYEKAMKRAQKENGHLANLIENVILLYGGGANLKAMTSQNSLWCEIAAGKTLQP